MKRLFAVVLGLVIVGMAMACGPSFQAIYEGNSRFEHCYALEENGQTALHEKADCWRDWSEHYTYGQTRDRIHYATARYVALSQSTNAPTDEAMMMAAPGMTPRQSTITAPAPTNAFAPPPKVLDEQDAASATRPLRPSELPAVIGAADAATTMATPPLPGADCSDVCGTKFRTCKDGDAGPPACEKTYRACMRACFK